MSVIARVKAGALEVMAGLDHLLIGSVTFPVDDKSKSEPVWPFGWAPALALLAGLALLIMTHAANMSPVSDNGPVTVFYFGIMVGAVPICCRLAWPYSARPERLALVYILTLMLFCGRLIREPIAFIDHDTMLHWVTANAILEHKHLFTPNPLLPVSPLFPGLEIVATAIVNMTGLPIFEASVILALVARLAFVSGLFLAYERITGSSLVAGLATIIYAGSSNFFIFDASFSYEAIAISILGVVLLASALVVIDRPMGFLASLAVLVPMLLAISVSHHMTAFVTAGLMIGLALLLVVQRPRRSDTVKLLLVLAACAAAVGIWPHSRSGSVDGYIGPLFEGAMMEVIGLFTKSSTGRVPFQAATGVSLPKWQILFTLGSLIFIAIGLARGFLRALRAAGCRISLNPKSFELGVFTFHNPWLALLTLVTLLWPVSIILRLTAAGWEIGNRIGPFAYFGIGLVVAIAFTSAPAKKLRGVERALGVGFAVVTIVIGGIISSAGGDLLPRMNYRPAADAASLEPTGISAATWAGTWLGPGNRFVSDRVNNLLLATYGRQRIVTPLYDDIEAGPLLLLADKFGKNEINMLREHDIGFIMTDLRLTTDLPAYGFYMNPASDIDRDYAMPLDPDFLLKFNEVRGIDRVFDNGNIMIFDVRNVINGGR